MYFVFLNCIILTCKLPSFPSLLCVFVLWFVFNLIHYTTCTKLHMTYQSLCGWSKPTQIWFEVLDQLDRLLLINSPLTQLLSYDTTFWLGDFYVSPLLFRHTLFKEFQLSSSYMNASSRQSMSSSLKSQQAKFQLSLESPSSCDRWGKRNCKCNQETPPKGNTSSLLEPHLLRCSLLVAPSQCQEQTGLWLLHWNDCRLLLSQVPISQWMRTPQDVYFSYSIAPACRELCFIAFACWLVEQRASTWFWKVCSSGKSFCIVVSFSCNHSLWMKSLEVSPARATTTYITSSFT